MYIESHPRRLPSFCTVPPALASQRIDVPTFQSKLHRSFGAKIPARSGRSEIQTCPLLLSKLKAPINHAGSTLLQVFFLKNLKLFEINTFEKRGGGSPLWLTNCFKRVSAKNFAGIPAFHLPYTLPSSVSRNSFVCHSYENSRGVYQQFPFWNSPAFPFASRTVLRDLFLSLRLSRRSDVRTFRTFRRLYLPLVVK